MQEKIAARIAEKLAKKKAKAEAEQAAKKASAAEAKAMNKKKTLAYLKSLKVIKGNAGQVSNQFDKPTSRPDRPTSVPSSGPSTESEEFNSFEEDIEYPKPPVRRNKKTREDIYNL